MGLGRGGLLLVAALAAGCAAPPPAAVAIRGVATSLHDQTERYDRAGIAYWRWRTLWSVRWEPVAGAAEYEVVFKTSEGVSPKTQRVTVPSFEIEVAKGDNPVAAGTPTRDVQLLTIQGLLAIQVVPRRADGERGTPSAWLPVGSTAPHGHAAATAPT